jgi:hypothetical protein
MSSSLPYSVVVGNKPTIGSTLAGGTTGSVLFINPTNIIAQDNANFFYDDTNNRLGIGTSTPTTTLQVAGGKILLDNAQGIQFKDGAGTARTVLQVDSGDNLYLDSTATNGDMYLRARGVDKMTIKSSGSVGIGTTTPAYKLDVNGDISVGAGYKLTTVVGNDLNLDTPASRSILMKTNGTTRLTMDTNGSLLSQVGTGIFPPHWRFFNDHITNVELFLGNQSLLNRTAVIGWNDTSAYGFLTVFGSANTFRFNATDFTRNGTAYTNPDYVLEHWATGKIVQFADREGAKNYDGLRKLCDVEASVRTTYALPRIADWRDGKAGGNGLFGGGEACLASIEEAYLYLFQHEATITQLAKTVKEQNDIITNLMSRIVILENK